ncbi:MAG: 2-phospho-L-lactate transferase [Gammaproteobacteria bacterium]|nr:2-phospho-L-lactate transferase [Gammaproteobacteria bacterium]
MPKTSIEGRYLIITGGVGGAKLALGLAHCLKPIETLFAVNTGDDFEHLGLSISPDLDTLVYTLADMNNKEVGWGRVDESWQFMDALEQLGGPTWFKLGDRDLALHTTRSRMLAEGATLSEATSHICTAFGIPHRVVPMSDDPVRTTVHTDDGELSFQHYFVRDRCKPVVTGFEFKGIEAAVVQPEILACLENSRGVIICPSNPFVSVDPILNLPGMRNALSQSPAPVVAVSPIVGGTAIKGPTAKMMRELNIPVAAEQVADHYRGVIDGFILDEQDLSLHETLDMPTYVAQTVMVTLQDRVDLGRTVLEFINSLDSKT